MILAFDSYYFDGKAKTVCLAFEQWTDATPAAVYTEMLEGIEDYTPGEFYKRELPCIISLLKQISYPHIKCIIVDGFVFLDDDGKLGLGGHLYHQLNAATPVIGLAKTNFATIEHHKRALLRGESQKPLYITAIGLPLEVALDHIKQMSGTYRIPTLLKHLDTLTKE